MYSGAVYCSVCKLWLNGPAQFDDHKTGKKHRKNRKKAVAKACAAWLKGPQDPTGETQSMASLPSSELKAPCAGGHWPSVLSGSMDDGASSAKAERILRLVVTCNCDRRDYICFEKS